MNFTAIGFITTYDFSAARANRKIRVFPTIVDEDLHMRVAFLQGVCADYDIPMFEAIAKLSQINLHAYFGRGPRISSWKEAGLSQAGFKYSILPVISWNPGKINASYFVFHPTLIFKLISGKYEVVISESSNIPNLFPVIFLCKIMRKKLILQSGGTIRDNAPRSNSSFARKLYYTFIRLTIKSSDSCVAYSSLSKEFLEYLGAKPTAVFVAPRAIDTDFFIEKAGESERILSLKRKLGVENKKVVLYVGALERRKRIPDLLQAFAEIQRRRSDVALLIVGEGNAENELLESCRNENIKSVSFLGRVKKEEMPYYYSVCDVLVLPSQGGVVLNEAMACGKPVIASISDGRHVDLVRDGASGFIFKEGDIVLLSKIIDTLLSDSELARKMGIKALEITKDKFTPDKMAEGFAKAINYTLRRRLFL